MLEFMSCACPVILGVDGQARQILEQAEAGIVIEPENSEALVHAILQLKANQKLGIELGQKGRRYIVANFSRATTAQKYLEVLKNEVLGKEILGTLPAKSNQ
jgi:glycosyltransferase involved in cell wall biosynthesis